MSQHQDLLDIIREFDEAQARYARRGRPMYVQPLIPRRYGDISWVPSENSKQGLRALCDMFYILCIFGMIGGFMCLGLYFYLRPFAYLYLAIMYFKTSPASEYYVPAMLFLRGAISVTLTLMDQFTSDERFSAFDYVKWAFQRVENIIRSGLFLIITFKVLFYINVTDPTLPGYCHPILFATLLFEFALSWPSRILDCILARLKNNSGIWKKFVYLGIWLMKLFLRLIPLANEQTSIFQQLVAQLRAYTDRYQQAMDPYFAQYVQRELDNMLLLLS